MIAKVSQAGFASRRACQSNQTNAGRPPSHAPAASKCSDVGQEMDVSSKARRRSCVADHCRQREQKGCGRELKYPQRRTKQQKRQHHRQPEPRAPDETEARFEEHGPCAAMQADIDERRRQNVGGKQKPARAAPDRMTTASASQVKVVSRSRSGRKSDGGLVGSATNRMKPTVPHATNVAAKCTPRTKINGSAMKKRLPPYGPTRKVKSPCVRCVSTDNTRHITL